MILNHCRTTAEQDPNVRIFAQEINRLLDLHIECTTKAQRLESIRDVFQTCLEYKRIVNQHPSLINILKKKCNEFSKENVLFGLKMRNILYNQILRIHQ